MPENSNDLLSIVIVSYNTKEHLRHCLGSIARWPATTPYEVLVVDNASSDGSADMVADEYAGCRLIRLTSNEGYGVAINLGVRETKGNWLMFLNPDIEVTEQALDTLMRFAKEHTRAGIVGPRLLLANGQPQASARRFISSGLLLLESSRLHLLLPSGLRGSIFLGTYFLQDKTMRVPWISGACHLIPRAVWEQVGLLTEETFCGSDDYDYCYRVRQHGYEVWLCAEASMTHYCSVAVRKRWSTWEVEQVAIHNFYVVLESHWPTWRVKTYYLAEMLSNLMETVRHMIKPRLEQDAPDSTYRERLRNRMALNFRLLLGRQRPIKRFQPSGKQQSV